jgi:DNA-binding HxlR family transcriptional regulator
MAQAISSQRGRRDSEGDRSGPDDTLSPMETLQLVTDETRRAIITTLWNADEPLRFSTLRRRSGIAESARFNYHLQQLLERCVRDTGEGYELTVQGERFVAAMCAVPRLDEQAD